uniref:Uncharacterized protein n=1 Tax=Anguilla anguilla TaxID=7936 RepID=A0A0E9VBT0_ANGAN
MNSAVKCIYMVLVNLWLHNFMFSTIRGMTKAFPCIAPFNT